MNLRVSSSDDQMTWRTPAAFAAFAMWRASAISFSGEKCAQKNVTKYAPYAPSSARARLASSSTSAATTSAPACASARAFSESTSRVIARAAKPPAGSARIARTSPPPCAPVAPTTAMIFLSAMARFPGECAARGLRGRARIGS